MSQPLAIAYPCDCGDCDFCGSKRDKSESRVVEMWRRAAWGDNVNTDLHICRKCAGNLVTMFDTPDNTKMIRGKVHLPEPKESLS